MNAQNSNKNKGKNGTSRHSNSVCWNSVFWNSGYGNSRKRKPGNGTYGYGNSGDWNFKGIMSKRKLISVIVKELSKCKQKWLKLEVRNNGT